MTAPVAGLSDLRFVDPQHDPSWAHVLVPGGGGPELASAPRAPAVEVVGAGRVLGLDEWLEETSATSLLVADRSRVLHEWYAAGHGPDTLFLGASMTKSVLAHLVGRAVRAGALGLDDRVAGHVPELAWSGYAGTQVVDLLTMTTGVDWVEDHRDPASPASRLLQAFATGGDSRVLLGEVRAGTAPGTRFGYCTADSQVLDWVRERATGRSYAEDVAVLWRELGCTRGAAVAVDGLGVALAGGGLAAATRDWARAAMLAVAGISTTGLRLLDDEWVRASARPSYPFLGVGRLPSSITAHAGFGYHWWPMDDDGRRLTADGSRGQFAAADRVTGAVVVKTSCWPYGDFLVDRQARDLSYLGLHALLGEAGTAPTQEDTP